MSDFKTATNPETGERLIMVDGKPQPLNQFRTATNPETGEQMVEINGKLGSIGKSPDIVQTNAGGTFGERAKAGFSITPQGKLSFVQSLVGKDNAISLPNGDVAFRRAENETFRPFDPNRLDIGDIADLTGVAMEAIPGIVATAGNTPGGRAGTAIGTAIRAGLADAGGNAGRQAISAALPGDDEATMGDRALSMGTAAVVGGGGQTLADKVIAPGLARANPKNAIVSRPMQKAQETPFAIKGRRLSQQVRIPQTIGEETGSRMALMAEGLARRHPGTADAVSNLDSQKIAAARQRLQAIAENLSKNTDKEDAGLQVARAFNQAQDEAINVRRLMAARDFSVIDSAAGDMPILPVTSYLAKINELIANTETLARDTTARTGLIKLRNDLVDAATDTQLNPTAGIVGDGEGVRASGRVFQKTLSQYSKAARGTGQIIKDLDANEQRDIARQLLGALEEDLERAASQKGLKRELGTALQVARDNYRQNSENINVIAESALGRILNVKTLPAAEDIADKLNRLRPSKYREAIQLLETASPEALATVKRSTLDDMIEKSSVSGSSKLADGGTFSPTKFNTLMLKPENAARMRILYGRDEFVQIKRVSKAMERINSRMLDGSPTAPLEMMMQFANAMSSGIGLTQVLGQLLSVRTIAKAMEDPAARRAIIEISQTRSVTRKTAQAAATVAGLLVAEDSAKRKKAAEERIRTPRQSPGL